MNKKVLTLCAGVLLRSAGKRFSGIYDERFERGQ